VWTQVWDDGKAVRGMSLVQSVYINQE
jgi:hypothetical protein